jgi:hypothetical protein
LCRNRDFGGNDMGTATAARAARDDQQYVFAVSDQDDGFSLVSAQQARTAMPFSQAYQASRVTDQSSIDRASRE